MTIAFGGRAVDINSGQRGVFILFFLVPRFQPHFSSSLTFYYSYKIFLL